MKRALSLSLAAILAFPLLAEEAKKTSDPAIAAKTESAAPGDSAMVQAAKLSKRGRKGTSKIVITNASLKGSKGHVTTTTVQHPVNIPEPEAGPEQKLLAQKAAKAAEEKRLRSIGSRKERETAAAREKRLATAAEAAEDAGYDLEDADPAQAEQAASEQKPPA